MRLHDTPKSSPSATAPRTPAGGPVSVPRASLAGVLGFLVIVVLLGVLAWSVLRADDAGSAGSGTVPDCARIRVTTTAEFAPVVEAATERLAGVAEPCTRYDLTTASSAVAAEQIGAGTDLPHVWIPDSDVWVERANEVGAGPTLDAGPTLATTPVVLAVPSSLAPEAGSTAAQPWAAILDGPFQLRIADPGDSTSSLLTLVSAAHALSGTPQGDQLLLGSTITMSRQTTTEEMLFAQASDDAVGATAVPATEQQIFRQRAEEPDSPLEAVLPAEPVGALGYSWVVVADDEQDDATRDAVAALGRSLTGFAGLADARAAGFRTADGEGAPDVPGAVTAATVPPPVPTLGEADAIVAGWDAAQRDVRMLAVIDVSTSMLEPAGDRTRIELATDGFQTALEIFPPASQVGQWMFSSGHVTGNDWTELAPIAPLDTARAGGGTHHDTLLAEAASLADRTDGGTGLYDTVRAAYRAVQEDYDPGAVNAVVVLTDGREDDFDGLTLYRLLVELQANADPDRPVPVYIVGVGPDVFAHELRLISELTGGRHYLAPDPAEAGAVFVDALTRHFRPE